MKQYKLFISQQMTDRLISEEKFIADAKEKLMLDDLVNVWEIVNDQPTAYDVDEKIAKLEALKVPEGLGANCPYNRERCGESNCETCILDYAIDIVKGGVANDM